MLASRAGDPVLSRNMKSDKSARRIVREDSAELLREALTEIHAARFKSAEQLLARAVKQMPDSARAQHLLGVALHEQDAVDRAIACYRKALRLDPEMIEAHCDMAAAHTAKGRPTEALASYREALRIDADDEDASRGAAEALWALGQFSEARRIFQRVLWLKLRNGLRRILGLQKKPDRPAVVQTAREASVAPIQDLVSQGVAAFNAGRFGEAQRSAEQAIAADPASVAGHLLFAGASGALGKDKESELHSRRALELDPKNADALLNLGASLKGQDRLDEALVAYERALQLRPDSADLFMARGKLSLEGYARIDEALGWFSKALRVRPGDVRAELDEASALLLCGRFAEGWERYEARKRYFAFAELHARVHLPAWDGGRLEGRSIALYGEQGLGDEIMFASCIGDVLRMTRDCHILVNQRLTGLFARSFPVANVVSWTSGDGNATDAKLPRADLACAFGSLPRYLRRSAGDFPDHRGYLVADPVRVARWRDRLEALESGACIGISWRGGFPWTGAARRSLDLARLEPLLRVPGIAWVSMQYTDCQAEIERFAEATGIRIHHWQDAIDDLEEHAALACALDHRVSVCTAFAHLCGALGKPVSILAPYVPEWRYGMEHTRMIWYPSVRLYRQPKLGSWIEPVQQLVADLREFVKLHSRPGAV